MPREMTESELTTLIKQLNLDELNHEVDINLDESSESESGITSSKDGRIQVKDQRIIVYDPKEGGKKAVISAVDQVKLKVNDTYISSECEVTSDDIIYWEIDDNMELFHILISNDKLRAHFQLISRERYAWRLIDTEPKPRVLIEAELNKDLVLEAVHLSTVVSKIEERSIISNFKISSIQHELENPTYQPILIAEGKEPIPGKDAQLELYFSEQVEQHFFEVFGNIDFRNHLQIPSVREGDVIGKKIPLKEGIPGFDVLGGVITPTPPKDIMVVTKSSVEMTSDGDIIALKDGRPRVTGGKIKTFDISTAYVVSGNVDIETGNIVFSGDVIVYGNVTDNMIIESLGNVYVYGSVYNATISATGSVYVRGNVLGSRLYCGYFGVLFNRLYNASKMLGENFEKMLAASKLLVEMLNAKNQKVNYGQIILLLMESKFKEIPAIAKELLIVVSNIQNIKKDEYQKLQEFCSLFLQPSKLIEKATFGVIQSFLLLLQETYQEVARMQEEKTEIKLNQCHKTEVKSNGDIFILQDGVILSNLYAARTISFQHSSAVCRGSRLEAGDSIIAKNVGGETGVNTLLIAKRNISVQKMLSGRICVDKHCIDIESLIENKTFDRHYPKGDSY